MAFFYYKKKDTLGIDNVNYFDFSIYKQFLIEGALILLFYYIFKFFSAESYADKPFWFDQDNIAYSKNIWYILNSGVESGVAEFIDLSIKPVSPYHYFDLWFGASIAYLTNLNYLHSLQLLSHPIGFYCIYLGVISLISFSEFKLKPQHKLFAIGIIFFTGFYISNYNSNHLLNRYGFFYFINAFKFPKNIISYIFILAMLNLYFNRKIYLAVLTLLSFVIAQIASAPAVVSTLTFLFIFVFIYTKEKKYLNYLWSILFVSIFLVLFYFVFNTKGDGNIYSQNFTKEYLMSFLSIKVLLSLVKQTIGDGFIGFVIIHIFNLLLCFYLLLNNFQFWKKKVLKHSMFVLFITMFFISGLFISFLFNFFMPDSFQFFSTTGTPLFCILIFSFLFYNLFITSNINKYVIVLFVILNFAISPKLFGRGSEYSKLYISKTNDVFKNLNPLGIYLMNTSEYMKNINHWTPILGVKDYHLCVWNRNAHTIALSVYDIPKESNGQISNAVKLSPFYIFVENQKRKNNFHSIEKSQIDFIDFYKIDYLITSGDFELNNSLKSRVRTIILDTLSKERFILLNHK